MVRVKASYVHALGIGMTAIGAVAVCFFGFTILSYNTEIGNLSKSGNAINNDVINTEDMSLGMLLVIEAVFSAVFLAGGAFGAGAFANKSSRVALFVISLLSFAAFASTGMYRAFTIWGSSPGQCRYFGDGDSGIYGDVERACPTTRHENTGPGGATLPYWTITQIEPTLESDCVFWFWDNTFTLESVIKGDGTGSEIIALKDDMIEHMNWAQKNPYGWLLKSGCDSAAADCIQDGRSVFKNMEINNTNGVAISTKLNGKTPDITFCYYWGCSQGCNGDRYMVNRLLLYGSLGMALVTIIISGISGTFVLGTLADGYVKLEKNDVEEAKTIVGPVLPNLKPAVRNRALRF
jgi:hypothetical protein